MHRGGVSRIADAAAMSRVAADFERQPQILAALRLRGGRIRSSYFRRRVRIAATRLRMRIVPFRASKKLERSA